ncbi:hypothetical protein [Microbispora sp. GKU 823]|uniref:hypothetical protein n=1 Tax=Microbispora sp. GKU 823 TaxID=1652100 RepID=UPI0021172C1B|nr:hypothetical protein [Microbispora sp. GKU 823]
MLTQGLTVVVVVLTAQAAGLGRVATAVAALTALVAFEPALPLAAAGRAVRGGGRGAAQAQGDRRHSPGGA